MTTRTQILVRGIVQGVGFRPYVFSLAKQCSLKGQVLNSTSGVVIDVEGTGGQIEKFINNIKTNPPPLSVIDSVERRDSRAETTYRDFRIVESLNEDDKLVPISADMATCTDCLNELNDPDDRRYRYPFINCTNCGPRFSIVEDIP
jgi:hydrogenase maturation protein HypF